MSLERGFDWQYDNFLFKGFSIAGQTTSLYFKNPKICFDIAQGLPFHLSAKLFCLTHLHADHGSGLNYLLSQRSLYRLKNAKIMLPKSTMDSVHCILKEWQKIEGFEYDYELIGSEHDKLYELDDQWSVKSFKTTHRVDSFGYVAYRKKKQLKAEYQGLERQEILDLKSKQVVIEEEISEPIMAFTGDTQIEFVDSHPDFLKAKMLFVECTYLDDRKSLEETRKWGHLHLDELIEKKNKFENEHISLIHLSSRYSTNQAKKILDEKLDPEFLKKVSIFPRPL